MLENITSQEHSFWEFKGNNDYVDKWFLMSSPLPVLMIWLAYLAFVLKIGPEFMKKRAPFTLNNVLIIYNALQVLVSCFVLCVGCNILLQNGFFLQRRCISDTEDLKKNTNKSCTCWKAKRLPIIIHRNFCSPALHLSYRDLRCSVLSQCGENCVITVGIYYYFFAKVTELLDTVFFVLRKNDRQVTFLHVYHHSITMLVSWSALKYEPSYSTIFLGTLNSFIHIIMYTYYGLSTFPDLTKYLWWKKYITTLQLVQFLLIVLQFTVNYKFLPCRPSYILFGVIVFNTLLFMYLFSDFYIKSYIKKNQKCAKTKGESYDNKMDHVPDNKVMVNKNQMHSVNLHTFKHRSKRN